MLKIKLFQMNGFFLDLEKLEKEIDKWLKKNNTIDIVDRKETLTLVEATNQVSNCISIYQSFIVSFSYKNKEQ